MTILIEENWLIWGKSEQWLYDEARIFNEKIIQAIVELQELHMVVK